jgi:5-oxoprolinase (ATP-hydrolysing)
VWRFAIDVGGTFADVVAVSPRGETVTHKCLSSGRTPGRAGQVVGAEVRDDARAADPDGFWVGATFRMGRDVRRVVTSTRAGGRLVLDAPLEPAPRPGTPYELDPDLPAPLVAMRWVLGLPAGARLPPVEVRLGTTRGTNALLTRTGARTALVTTRGHGDVLAIGTQDRPRLFDLHIVKPDPLPERVLEVDERLDADGRVLRAPDPARVRADLEALRAAGIESLAICLLHAHVNPAHERLVAELARQVGFAHPSVSSELARREKLVPRAETTALDAYLSPVLTAYVAELEAHLAGAPLAIMTSAGSLVSAGHFRGKDSILSGPAGGVVGLARAAREAGFVRAIGLDMGGTSTDVSRWDGSLDLEFESTKAGVRIMTPMLAIETVAAGGGSVCGFDGVMLSVGPGSAGAEPGPACYGRGGPLAITDLDAVLGKLPRFPFPLDLPAAHARLEALAAEVARAPHGRAMTVPELAQGLVDIADARMARAVRRISVERGIDPVDHVLVAFGAAAGQHACAVAKGLGIRNVLAHPHAGVLSAAGIGVAEVRVIRERAARVRLGAAGGGAPLAALFAELADEARTGAAAEGVVEAGSLPPRRSLDLRYEGQEAFLTVAEPADGAWEAAFAAAHARRYGWSAADRAVEVVAARVEVGRVEEAPRPAAEAPPRGSPRPVEERPVYFGGAPVPTGVYLREDLAPGHEIPGPAILCEPTSTLVIDPGFSARVLSGGAILVTGTEYGSSVSESPDPRNRAPSPVDRAPSPVDLEIWNGRFGALAEQMGVVLRRTASSTNVKERLDFSCALFGPAGDLVVNAPHIPVHLGAMSETIRVLLREGPPLAPGDVVVTNDPYRGGSHLPDITVVTPVFVEARLAFFVACRAHHADVGGIAPGSMPPFSRTLAEEGVVIEACKLVDAGVPRHEALRALLSAGPHPARRIADNLADLDAQVAANQWGAEGLAELAARHGLPAVQQMMVALAGAAAAKTRAALARLPRGRHTFVDHLDDGSPVAVAITIEEAGATFDFTGTGPVLPGNLNATPAIVTAAVLYAVRCLLDEDIPLNAGVLEPLRILVPEGTLLAPPAHPDPARRAAVVGGNVETSQRIVDAILGALGVAAASQGTMNNLALGDDRFGYYETICGGAGATPKGPGADAVHTHMTNTRLTDPEVLERRAPVRLWRFAIRRGSGGPGLHRGGDGVVRELELLAPVHVSLLTERRGPYAPWGAAGGGPGALGRNLLLSAGAAEPEVLGAKVSLDARPGDRIVIETPGGGGWGTPA